MLCRAQGNSERQQFLLLKSSDALLCARERSEFTRCCVNSRNESTEYVTTQICNRYLRGAQVKIGPHTNINIIGGFPLKSHVHLIPLWDPTRDYVSAGQSAQRAYLALITVPRSR